MSTSVRANGEANSYTLLQGSRWLANIRFNGELLPVRQAAIAQGFAGAADGIERLAVLADPAALAAVLAGLRLLQRSDTLPIEIDRILTDDGSLPRICESDIDLLCEQLNCLFTAAG